MTRRPKPLNLRARLFSTGIRKPGAVVINPLSAMPRFWAAVWFAYHAGKSWSATVEETHCRGLHALYLHCDEHFGAGSLDSALSEFNDVLLQEMLRTFHASLSIAQNISTTTQKYWDTARRFVSDLLIILSLSDPTTSATSRFLAATGRLRLKLRKRVASLRALPSSTMHEICYILDPASPLNPRSDFKVRMRNWLILHLLFRAGLRRGEMLLLRVDSLFSDIDSDGNTVWWISVNTLEEEDAFYESDGRYSQPQVKNAEAVRNVPADADLVALWEEYIQVRPEGSTGFLLTADGARGLSKESLDRLFQEVTALLTPKALEAFRRRSGKKHISCHDFRHTCAVVAYAYFQQQTGQNRETTFGRLKTLFGWSESSKMPSRYARVAVTDDLVKSWNTTFAKQLSTLRKFQ